MPMQSAEREFKSIFFLVLFLWWLNPKWFINSLDTHSPHPHWKWENSTEKAVIENCIYTAWVEKKMCVDVDYKYANMKWETCHLSDLLKWENCSIII